VNELFLRIAIDDIHHEMDHRTNNATQAAALDADNHLARMRRLINWQGPALGAAATPVRDRVAPCPVVAPAPA
jgi:hypothetical protein